MWFDRFKKHEKKEAVAPPVPSTASQPAPSTAPQPAPSAAPLEPSAAPQPMPAAAATAPAEVEEKADYTLSFTPQNLFWTLTCDYIECVPLGTEDAPELDRQGGRKVRVTAHLPERPEALGLEMPEGAWFLLPDGTMRFFGGTWLYSGAFDTHRNKVKRLVIDDFNYILESQFEGFPQLEEVVFSNPAVHVDHRAFAGCHKLRTVRFRDEGPVFDDWAEDGAFDDTPYAASLKGEEFESEADKNAVLAKSEWGRAFLEGLHGAIEHMEYDHDDEYEYCGSRFSDELPVPCKRALYEGYVAGDSDAMYLAAEYTFWAWVFDLNLGGAFGHFNEEEVYAAQLYLAAADAGSVRAMLYVAWLLEPGSAGMATEMAPGSELFEPDAQRSARYLERARAASAPLDTLEITDLAFLKEEVARLREAAYDADRMEDIMLYGVVPPRPDDVPNPSWRVLHERCNDLARLACALGCAYCVDEAVDGYRSHDRQFGLVRAEKRGWAAWCREKGMLV